MTGFGQKFVGSTLWMAATQGLTTFLAFGVNIILARLLQPSDFGVFALALSIWNVFLILSSWSFPVALVQAGEVDQRFFDTAFASSLLLGVGRLGIVILSTLVLRRFYSTQVLQILVLLAAIQILFLLSRCYSATRQRGLEYRSVSIVQVGATFFGMGAAVLAAWFSLGAWSLAIRQAIMALGSLIGMRMVTSWRFRWGFDRSAARRLLGFSSKMFVSSGLESFLYSLQNLQVGTAMGETQLGYFDRSVKLAELGQSLTGQTISQVSLSAYSRLQTDRQSLSRAYDVVSYFLVRVFLLLGLLFLFLGEDVTVLLYGEKWRAAGTLAPWLAVYVACTPIFGNARSLLYSQARIDQAIKVRVVQAVLLALGLWLVLPRFGLVGAAGAISLFCLIATVQALWYAERYAQVHWTQVLFPAALSAVIAGGVFWYLQQVVLGRLLLLPLPEGMLRAVGSWAHASGLLGWLRLAADSGLLRVVVGGGALVILYGAALLLLDKKRLRHDLGELRQIVRARR